MDYHFWVVHEIPLKTAVWEAWCLAADGKLLMYPKCDLRGWTRGFLSQLVHHAVQPSTLTVCARQIAHAGVAAGAPFENTHSCFNRFDPFKTLIDDNYVTNCRQMAHVRAAAGAHPC